MEIFETMDVSAAEANLQAALEYYSRGNLEEALAMLSALLHPEMLEPVPCELGFRIPVEVSTTAEWVGVATRAIERELRIGESMVPAGFAVYKALERLR